MKRVLNLYRVSTKGQVEKDDIPMQRIACTEYAQRQGWTIVDEVSEKGVSGYKNLAEDRDVLTSVLQDAKEGKFDILLLFMLDRLGRRSFDTPRVVLRLADYGVEVWTVQEGLVACTSPEDEMILFMRCWGAEGESRKTSIRVRERYHQLLEQGMWPGGVVPLGYRAVHKGRCNKKNQPIKDLEVDAAEAEVVRELFRKAVLEGYGSHMLAAMLNARGLRTHKGAKFQSNTVLRVLRNPIYTGFLVAAGTVSPHLPELQIVEQQMFLQANEILDQRDPINEKKRHVAMTNKGRVLLSGNIYCAHCKARLASIRYRDTYEKKDGTIRVIEEPKYLCYHRSRQLNDCDGAHTYKASIVDGIATDVAKKLLSGIRETPKDVSVKHRLETQIAQMKRAEKELAAKCTAKAQELERLQAEIGKCLLGQSCFSEDVLSAEIDRAKAESERLRLEHQKLAADIENQNDVKSKIGGYFDQFVSWADEFEQASLERKKMICNELFERVEVGKGYAVDITVNPNYQQFLPEEGDLLEAM